MTEPPPTRVLLADDEVNFRRVIRTELQAAGFEVAEADRGDEALLRLEVEPFDVVLLDLRMPGLDGLEVLRRARRAGNGAEVIVLTGHGTIESVVEAMKLGAFDYLTKPCRLAEIEVLVSRAARKRRGAPAEAAGAAKTPGDDDLLSASPAMARVVKVLDRAAPADAPVLVEGESGVGKELAARRLHARSAVAAGPFIVIHCGAIQEGLLLSELFGHEKGAFTGADRRKMGLFERAHGGTLFLDEIGELPAEGQVRLLRFLQSGELRRVGGHELLSVRARVVAATNRRLADEVKAGRFREDLFYRLNTIHVTIPPLRERPDEIAILATRFLARSAAGRGRSFHPEALALLAGYPWPGNVRELENIVERLAILSDAAEITPADVREHFDGLALTLPGSGAPAPGAGPRKLRDVERAEIVAALARTGGDKVKAADELGIALKTLYNKIKAYGIPVEPRRPGAGG